MSSNLETDDGRGKHQVGAADVELELRADGASLGEAVDLETEY